MIVNRPFFVDRQKAATLDLELNDVFQTMQGYLGTFYANDFNKFNYTYQVRIQADNRFRNSIQELKRLEVRNRKGDMVPLGTLTCSWLRLTNGLRKLAPL